MNINAILKISGKFIFALGVLAVLLILSAIIIDPGSHAQRQAPQNRALQQTKGIFYGLKMFATDHNGRFPSILEEDFTEYGPKPALTDANHAFANIVPTYVQSENPFSVSSSAYCKGRNNAPIIPDNDFSDRREVLVPGENQFAYVLGLYDTSNENWPIIADGFAGGPGAITNPTYSNDQSAFGGVWGGRNAIVVRCDGSASILAVNQATLTILRPGKAPTNLFTPSIDPADPWLTGCAVLNPLQAH